MRYTIYLIVLLLVSCEETPSLFDNYQTSLFQDSLTQVQLRQWSGQKPTATPLSSWYFSLGDSTETLNIPPTDIPPPDSLVNCPHRLYFPNRAFWYTRNIQLSTPKLLWLNADDGAQVYYQNQRLPQRLANAFVLMPSQDSVQLCIRVLNNALAGGLREALLFDLAPGVAFLTKQDPAAQLWQNNLPWQENSRLPNPMLLIEPFWQQVAPNEYVVKSASTSSAPISLHYGFTPTQLSTTITATRDTAGISSFSIKGLTLDTNYYYQLRQAEHHSSVYKFRPDSGTNSFSFTCWGDSQGGWPTFEQLTQQMSSKRSAFSIGLGDLVSNGALHTQWLDFLASLQPISSQRPVYPVIGNHDYDGYYNDLKPLLYQQYIRPDTYFSWSFGNCSFVALDANEHFPLAIQGKQRQWLEAQFETTEWQQAEWRFLLLHQPPYSQGWPGYHGDEFIRSIVIEYAESAGIDFVLSGHSHCYERLSKTFGQQNTHFLIMGGAGGGLEPPQSSAYPQMDTIIKAYHYGHFKVDDSTLQFQAIGLKGEILDSLTFQSTKHHPE